MRCFVACLFCVALILSAVHTTYAQSLGIDPLLVQHTLAPGSSLTYTINVQNEDRFEPLLLTVSTADISEDIHGVYNLLAAGTSPFSLAQWISLEPPVLKVPPAGEASVTVTINVPRGVSGGRYGAVVFSPYQDEHAADTGHVSPFSFRLGSFIELEITAAGTRREAYISRFSVQPSKEWPSITQLVGSDALVLTAEVANTGNTHVTALGTLTLQTADGRTVARFPLGGGRGIILPESTVALQSVLPPGLIPGDYKAKAIVEYGGRRPAVSEIEFTATESELQAQAASAEPLARFAVEPEEIDIKVRPGAMSSTILEVTNRGSEPISVDSRIVPLAFSLIGEPLPEEERGKAPEWITLNPASFTVEPGRSRRVRLMVRPPRDVVGGHYADLILATTTEAGTTETGASILIFVGDEIDKSGTVEVADIWQEGDLIFCDILFTNDGNYHVSTGLDFALRRVYEGYIDEETGRVVPRSTETVTSLSLPPGVNPVLPGTQRLFSFQIPADLEPGEYEIAVSADYGGEMPALAQAVFIIEEGVNEDEQANRDLGAQPPARCPDGSSCSGRVRGCPGLRHVLRDLHPRRPEQPLCNVWGSHRGRFVRGWVPHHGV